MSQLNFFQSIISVRNTVLAICFQIFIYHVAVSRQHVTTFGAVTEWKTPSSTQQLISGDFRGNGVADLATYGNLEIKFYFRDNDPFSYHSATFPVTRPIKVMHAAKCNVDRCTDIVALTSAPQFLQVYLVKPNGKCFLSWEYPLEDQTDDFQIADINNDHKNDILLYGKKQLGVTIFLGRGNGTFQPPTIILPEYSFNTVAVSGVNQNDTRNFIGSNWISNQISIFSGFGKLKFSDPNFIQCPFEPSFLANQSLDADSSDDFIAGWKNNAEFHIFKNNGSGDFQQYQSVTMDGPQSDVDLADVNGDGFPDLVTMDANKNMLNVVLNTGHGTLGEHVTFAIGQSPASMTLLHHQKSKLVDAAILDTIHSRICILYNARTPDHIRSEQMYATGSKPEGVLAGDINNDGSNDILVANNKSQSVSLLVNKGNGRFGGQIQFTVPDEPSSLSFIPKNDSTAIVLSTNPDSEKISFLEINLHRFSHTTYTLPTQGKSDVVFVQLNAVDQFLNLFVFEKRFSQQSLLKFEQIAPSRFIERIIPFQNGGSVQSLAMGNFHGTGVQDIVYCNMDAKSHMENFFQSSGNPAGTFEPPKLFFSIPDADSASSQFWHCDLNNDGAEDLVCNLKGASNLLYIFLGRRDSTLVPVRTQLQTSISIDRADRLKFIDVNNDGVKDIVLENHLNKTVEVYLSHGDGTFALPYRLMSSEGMGGFDIANLGGSQNPSLIVTDAVKGILKIISLK